MVDKAALGAALTTLGGELTKSRLEREELRRRKEAEAKEERRLQIQEQDAEQRREMNRIKLSMERVKYNNNLIKEAAVKSNFDPAVMGQAFTKHAGDGFVYTFNPTKSVANEDGSYSKIVYDIGTLEKKGAGVSGVGGVPTVKQLGPEGTEKVFESAKDQQGNMISATGWLTRYTSTMVNPDLAFARMEEDWTGEKRQQQMLDLQKKKAEVEAQTPQGKLAMKEQGLDIKLKEKKLAGDAPTTSAQAPVSTFTGATGEDIKQTAKDVEKAKQFAAAINKNRDPKLTPLDADDAARIMHLKNSKKAQKVIKGYATQVANGTMTREEFVEKFADSKLPEDYVQKMADKIGAMEPEEIKQPGLFARTWNKIFN